MNESPPLISIIVPNYNHERFLKQRLESVFNQSYSNFEVILLDDCSTDNSREILLEYAKHPKVSCCVFNEVNSGSPFKQWENGIAFAKGEYIWIAESDDYCELDFIDNIIDAMIKDSTIGLGYCQTIDVDVNCHQIYHRINYTKYFQPNIWVDNFEMDGRQFIQLYLSFFNVIPNASAVIFRRNLVDNFFFSESLLQMKMCGDWYFWIKIALKSKVFFCKKKLNCFRNHHSVTRNHNSIHEKKRGCLKKKIYAFLC
ncbi:glycosyltransferase family 2 protein [Flavobacterium nitratireducens]|uniref:glycosyltransferase family 2 protein n=1 Tax=Flavobacterium nitratireducens TaxID=992289 RepID=UPI002414ECF8|nr:glycosyltransferase family A protein [Flavobacterium nitratireducens]